MGRAARLNRLASGSNQVAQRLEEWIDLVRDTEESDVSSQVDLVVQALSEFSRSTRRKAIFLMENSLDVLSRCRRGGLLPKIARNLFCGEHAFFVCTAAAFSESEFIEGFLVWKLRPLGPDDVFLMLKRLAAVAGRQRLAIKIAGLAPKLRALYSFTRGNPRLVMKLYELLVVEGGLLAFDELDALLDQMTPVYRSQMASISVQEAKVLESFSRFPETGVRAVTLSKKLRLGGAVVRMVLRRLSDAGLVARVGTGKNTYYSVEEPLFLAWLRKNRQVPEYRGDYDLLVSWHARDVQFLPGIFGPGDVPGEVGISDSVPRRPQLADAADYVLDLSAVNSIKRIKLFRRIDAQIEVADHGVLQAEVQAYDDENMNSYEYHLFKGVFLAQKAAGHNFACVEFEKALAPAAGQHPSVLQSSRRP